MEVSLEAAGEGVSQTRNLGASERETLLMVPFHLAALSTLSPAVHVM